MAYAKARKDGAHARQVCGDARGLLALMASIGARKDGFDIDEFFTYGLAIHIISRF